MWQRNVTGAELSISSSVAGSFKVTPPLSNPVEMEEKKKEEEENKHRSTGGMIEKAGGKLQLKGCPVMCCGTLSYTNGCSKNDGGISNSRATVLWLRLTQEQKAISGIQKSAKGIAALTEEGWVFVSSWMDIWLNT